VLNGSVSRRPRTVRRFVLYKFYTSFAHAEDRKTIGIGSIPKTDVQFYTIACNGLRADRDELIQTIIVYHSINYRPRMYYLIGWGCPCHGGPVYGRDMLFQCFAYVGNSKCAPVFSGNTNHTCVVTQCLRKH